MKKENFRKLSKIALKTKVTIYTLLGIYLFAILIISGFFNKPITDLIHWEWWLMLFGVDTWMNNHIRNIAEHKKELEEEENSDKEELMVEELKKLANKKINEN